MVCIISVSQKRNSPTFALLICRFRSAGPLVFSLPIAFVVFIKGYNQFEHKYQWVFRGFAFSEAK
jgi:hypothetical protein